MEICTKLPVSECTDTDWFVDPLNSSGPRRARDLPVNTPYVRPGTATPSFEAGSTLDPPWRALQRFPRRVAFGPLPADGSPARPLGINNAGNIAPGVGAVTGNNALWFAASDNTGNVAYQTNTPPYQVNRGIVAGAGTTDGSRVPLPAIAANSSNLASPVLPGTNYDYKGSQPLLMPVSQLQRVTPITGAPPYDPQVIGTATAERTGWISQAVGNGTTFNLIVGAGDTPSRTLDGNNGDFNGGLQNLPRFLEVWSNSGAGTSVATNIKGSFIQQNRSAFSTAPYQPILPPNFVPANAVDRLATLFARSPNINAAPTFIAGSRALTIYNIQGSRIPYFTPPARNWGFDVGLLSQPPDLFTQRFTIPSTKTQPAEYFREVGRDDEWVKILMCGKVADQQLNANQNATSLRSDCPT
jgi:hypothetical protein